MSDTAERTFRLTDSELTAHREFQRHRCLPCDSEKTTRCVTVAFTPTGIGMHVELRCACGRVKDITDYASW